MSLIWHDWNRGYRSYYASCIFPRKLLAISSGSYPLYAVLSSSSQGHKKSASFVLFCRTGRPVQAVDHILLAFGGRVVLFRQTFLRPILSVLDYFFSEHTL